MRRVLFVQLIVALFISFFFVLSAYAQQDDSQLSPKQSRENKQNQEYKGDANQGSKNDNGEDAKGNRPEEAGDGIPNDYGGDSPNRDNGEKKFPDQVMITVHPQRWTDGYPAWIIELISQKIKNVIFGKELVKRKKLLLKKLEKLRS